MVAEGNEKRVKEKADISIERILLVLFKSIMTQSVYIVRYIAIMTFPCAGCHGTIKVLVIGCVR